MVRCSPRGGLVEKEHCVAPWSTRPRAALTRPRRRGMVRRSPCWGLAEKENYVAPWAPIPHAGVRSPRGGGAPCRRSGLCGPMGSETSCSDELASTLRHIDAHDEKPPPEGGGADVASTYWWSNVIGHGVISPDGEGTSCSHPFWEARLAILRQIGVVARGGLAKLGGGAPGRPRSRIGCRQGQTP